MDIEKLKLIFGTNINGTNETGLVHFENNALKIFCLCTKENADIILSSMRDKQGIAPCKVEWNDNMLQGSNYKRFGVLFDEITMNEYELLTKHHTLLKHIQEAMTEYSNLCQKDLFKALQIKQFVDPCKEVEEKCIEFMMYCLRRGKVNKFDPNENFTYLFNQFKEGEGKQ